MIVGRLLLRKLLVLVVQQVLRQVAQVFGSLSILPGPDADTGDEGRRPGERFDPREFVVHFVVFARKKIILYVVLHPHTSYTFHSRRSRRRT